MNRDALPHHYDYDCEEWRTAEHEAIHAVAAAHLNVKIVSVDTHRKPDRRGCCHIQRPAWYARSKHPERTARGRNLLEREMILTIAPFCYSEDHQGSCQSDLAFLDSTCKALGITDRYPLFSRAVELVNRPVFERHVLIVTTLLVVFRELNEWDVRKACGLRKRT